MYTETHIESSTTGHSLVVALDERQSDVSSGYNRWNTVDLDCYVRTFSDTKLCTKHF